MLSQLRAQKEKGKIAGTVLSDDYVTMPRLVFSDQSKAIYTVGLGSSSTGYSASAHNYQEPRSAGIELSFAL